MCSFACYFCTAFACFSCNVRIQPRESPQAPFFPLPSLSCCHPPSPNTHTQPWFGAAEVGTRYLESEQEMGPHSEEAKGRGGCEGEEEPAQRMRVGYRGLGMRSFLAAGFF